jgi:hypothetical protein
MEEGLARILPHTIPLEDLPTTSARDTQQGTKKEHVKDKHSLTTGTGGRKAQHSGRIRMQAKTVDDRPGKRFISSTHYIFLCSYVFSSPNQEPQPTCYCLSTTNGCNVLAKAILITQQCRDGSREWRLVSYESVVCGQKRE